MDNGNGKYISKKKRLSTLLHCIFLGWMGGHRFYVGRDTSGLAMMFTAGGFGIMWFIDCVMLLAGQFRDGENFPVKAWV